MNCNSLRVIGLGQFCVSIMGRDAQTWAEGKEPVGRKEIDAEERCWRSFSSREGRWAWGSGGSLRWGGRPTCEPRNSVRRRDLSVLGLEGKQMRWALGVFCFRKIKHL